MGDAEQALMRMIREKWAPLITAAVQYSSIPPAFLASLISLESGGVSDSSRFEPNVHAHLRAVSFGESPAYGSIDAHKLDQEATLLYTDAFHKEALARALTDNNRAAIAATEDDELLMLATSVGLCQVMIYVGLWELGVPPEDLATPEGSLKAAVQLCSINAHRFELDLSKDFAQLFTAWNCGNPYGKTYLASYVPNGLARMAIWNAL